MTFNNYRRFDYKKPFVIGWKFGVDPGFLHFALSRWALRKEVCQPVCVPGHMHCRADQRLDSGNRLI